MTGRNFFAAFAIVLALTACADDTYESVSKDIDQLMAEQIPLTTEAEAEIMTLREQGEQLQREGKTEDSVSALKQARDIIEKAKDADLLRKSEG
jgi:hypothetical protein